MKKRISNLFNRVVNADMFSKKVFTVLYSLAFVCIMIVSVSQVGLNNSNIRRFFTNVDDYEGGYFQATVNVEEEQYGILTFVAQGENVDKGQIYINGEVSKSLAEGENKLEISKLSVVEIYSPDGRIDVKITDVSDNLEMYVCNEQITADGGIELLCRVGKK